MTVESKDLETLRETTSRALITLLWVHLPIAVSIAMMRGTDWLWPALSWRCSLLPRHCHGAWPAMDCRPG